MDWTTWLNTQDLEWDCFCEIRFISDNHVLFETSNTSPVINPHLFDQSRNCTWSASTVRKSSKMVGGSTHYRSVCMLKPWLHIVQSYINKRRHTYTCIYMSLHIARLFQTIGFSPTHPIRLAARKSEKLWHDIPHGGDHGYPVAAVTNGGLPMVNPWWCTIHVAVLYPLIANVLWLWLSEYLLGYSNSFQKDGWIGFTTFPRCFPWDHWALTETSFPSFIKFDA